MKYSKPLDVPNTTLNRKKTFLTGLDLGVEYQGIDLEVKGQLQKAKNITLNVKKGKRYFIGSGTIAIQDVIYALPLDELTKIKFELANNNKVSMIAEVIEYEEAELVFTWEKEVGAGLKAKIPKILNLGNNNQWIDEATFVVKFKPGHLVSYKAVEIGKAYKKLIEQRIDFRQKNGDNKCISVKERIEGGELFHIILDGPDCGPDADGQPDSKDYFKKGDFAGALMCGSTYDVYYIKATNDCRVTGPDESNGKSISSENGGKVRLGDMNTNRLSLWGHKVFFDDEGKVFRKEDDGRILKYGRIFF